MLILGEVHTGLLQNSTALPSAWCERVLDLVEGEPVRRHERPIGHATTPDILTGVDCRLPTSSGTRVRGVGTVVHRATITAGHVLQGSATATVSASKANHRLPWSHYLARPGTIETTSLPEWEDIATGFLTAGPAQSSLDLGGISARIMDHVQASPHVDRSPPLRMARTRLRWVATAAGQRTCDQPVAFSIDGERERTLRLRCGEPPAAGSVAGFCEDLALHDWLLTTLLAMIDRSWIGGQARARTVERLRPAVDHLLHLWMPAARLGQDYAELWELLERRPGFSRQWHALVNRIRDQLSTSIIAALGPRLGGADP